MSHFNFDLNSPTGLIGAWIVVPALFLVLLTVILLTITAIHQVKQLSKSKKQSILDNQAESSKKQEQLKETDKNKSLNKEEQLTDNKEETVPNAELEEKPVSITSRT